MTEPESGSGAFSMKSTGEKTEGGYILNDRKIFVGMAPVADFRATSWLKNSSLPLSPQAHRTRFLAPFSRCNFARPPIFVECKGIGACS